MKKVGAAILFNYISFFYPGFGTGKREKRVVKFFLLFLKRGKRRKKRKEFERSLHDAFINRIVGPLRREKRGKEKPALEPATSPPLTRRGEEEDKGSPVGFL